MEIKTLDTPPISLPEQEEARRRFWIRLRCGATRASVVIAAVLILAALATPGEPGYQPEHAGGLVVTVIVCAAWIGLVWYANSRRRWERRCRKDR